MSVDDDAMLAVTWNRVFPLVAASLSSFLSILFCFFVVVVLVDSMTTMAANLHVPTLTVKGHRQKPQLWQKRMESRQYTEMSTVWLWRAPYNILANDMRLLLLVVVNEIKKKMKKTTANTISPEYSSDCASDGKWTFWKLFSHWFKLLLDWPTSQHMRGTHWWWWWRWLRQRWRLDLLSDLIKIHSTIYFKC